MAAPNIVGVTNIVASTNVATVTNVMSNVVVNTASSNSVVKINTIMIANYNTTATAANVDIYRNGISYLINGNIPVPGQSTLISSAKDTAFYLIEGDALRANTGANNYAHITVSYEMIS